MEKETSGKTDWADVYRTNDQRENTVLWLPIRRSDRVLVTGSGSGSWKSRLENMACQVTVMEEGKRWRHFLSENGEGYDWIIAGDGNALSASDLALIRRRLTPDGALFLSASNPYGLMYFAGCAEPESGRLFEGIEGYPEGGERRGRSLSAWQRDLQSAGFENVQAWYPFPDEIFCNRLFSDRFLPSHGELKNDTYSLRCGRLRLFDEQKAWDGVVENGLFPVFAGGFYLVAGKRPVDIIYAKFSTERTKGRKLFTTISEENGLRVVRKQAADEESVPHVERMETVYRETEGAFRSSFLNLNRCRKEEKGCLAFEYVTGENLDSLLDKHLTPEGSWDEEGTALVEEYAAEIRRLYGAEPFSMSPEFREVFGLPAADEGWPAARNVNIDLIFSNILVKDDVWQAIDYEWTFPFLIPADYVIYRALFFYAHQNEARMGLLKDETFLRFGLTPGKIRCFREMEQSFQDYVVRHYIPLRDIAAEAGRKEIRLTDLGIAEEDFRIARKGQEKIAEKSEEKHEGSPVWKVVGRETEERMETEKTGFWDKVRRKMSQIRGKVNPDKQTLFYSLDVIRMDPDTACLLGWAWSLAGKEVSFELRNCEGSEIPFELKRTNRPDVKKELYGEDGDLKAGYIIEFFRQNGKTPYRLTVSDGKHKDTVEFSSVTENYSFEEWYMGMGYDRWWEKHCLKEEEREEQKDLSEGKKTPFFSILVPAYKTPEKYLRELVESVQAQTWPSWELCFADGSGDDSSVRDILAEYAETDPRIRVEKLEENYGISGNTNKALEMAKGDWIALLDHDDTLEPDALFEMAKKIEEDEQVEAVYTDEDKITMDGAEHYDPHFKSDFNPDLLLSCNYICHFFAVKRQVAEEVGGFRSEYDGSQDYDFILRCTEKAGKTAHVPRVLYHWRVHPASTASDPKAKEYCYQAGKKAVEAALKRRGTDGSVNLFPDCYGYYQVTCLAGGSVSVLIPNRDQKEVLKTCIDSLLECRGSHPLEILIVENGSSQVDTFAYYQELQETYPEKDVLGEDEVQVRVLTGDENFNFAALNNRAAEAARGEYLLLLNNDVIVTQKDFLDRLCGDCARKEIGAVGVRLLYPDETIQHAGLIVGFGGAIAASPFHGYAKGQFGYNGRAAVRQNVSAVTAACMMVRREVYRKLGGMDEALKVAYNDVEFCLRLWDNGYRVLYNPDVTLTHAESKTRGYEDTAEKQERHNAEAHYLIMLWGERLGRGDPFYSPCFAGSGVPYKLPNRG